MWLAAIGGWGMETMRVVRRIGFFSVLGVLLLGSLSAHAGTLTNATWFQVAQGIPMTRTFGQLGASGMSTGGSIAVNLSYPFLATTAFVPTSPIDLHISITQGGPQAITATPGMAGGTPGVPGTVIVMSAAHVAKGVNQSMFHVGVNTVVQVPLSIGKAGQFTGTFLVVGELHRLTVDFYAWTPGTLVFTGLTSNGQALPTVTAAGSFNLNSMGGGTVTLVSPSRISIDGSLPRRTASFTTLVLTFVPEPGALLLLGAGGLALVLGGRRPRR
jgi:hypothetical protein